MSPAVIWVAVSFESWPVGSHYDLISIENSNGIGGQSGCCRKVQPTNCIDRRPIC